MPQWLYHEPKMTALNKCELHTSSFGMRLEQSDVNIFLGLYKLYDSCGMTFAMGYDYAIAFSTLSH